MQVHKMGKFKFKISKEKKMELAGAFTWAVIEGGLEANYIFNPTPGVFPYIGFQPPFDVLPPTDDLLVPATALIPLVAGNMKRKPSVEHVGRGALVYGMGNFMATLTMKLLIKQGKPLTYGVVVSPSPMSYGNGGKYVLRS